MATSGDIPPVYKGLPLLDPLECGADIGFIQQLIIWGLPVDFYASYRERLAAVTPEDVRTVATSRLTPNNIIVVVAGDLSKIEAPIRARNLGTVEVWDVNGNKVR